MKALFKKQWFQFVCFVLIIAVGFGVYKFAIAEESKAKRAVDGYLEAVKNGDEFRAIRSDNVLIDVFEYDFLKELDPPKEKKTMRIADKEMWEVLYGDKEGDERLPFGLYKRDELEKYKEEYEDLEVTKDEPDVLEIWDGESYVEAYRFLYNVEIADEVGQKLFKKAEITVENSSYWTGEEFKDGYVVTDVYLR